MPFCIRPLDRLNAGWPPRLRRQNQANYSQNDIPHQERQRDI